MKQPAASPVRARSLVQQIHVEVGQQIDAGDFAPEQTVGIADLARRYGVSPTPVREALARLAAEGKLRFTENIGYSVPPLPGARDYTDWALARLVVEPGALAHILGPLDARLLDQAETLNAHIAGDDFGRTAASVRRFSELNWRFHACLVGLARNPLLDQLHAQLYRSPQFSRIFLGRGVVHQQQVAEEHATVLRALRAGERGEAVAALRAHIVDSLERDARLGDLSLSLKRLDADTAPPRTTSRPGK